MKQKGLGGKKNKNKMIRVKIGNEYKYKTIDDKRKAKREAKKMMVE